MSQYSKTAAFSGRNARSLAAKFILLAQSEAIAFANGRAKARLATGWDEETVKNIVRKGGVWEEDGGGVANSYGYVAESSRLGIACWITPSKTIHIRVVGDRTRISGRHVSDLLPDNPAVAIYPALRFPLLVKEIKELPKQIQAIANAAREEPQDPANRAALADAIEEHVEAIEATTDSYLVRKLRELAASERAAAAVAVAMSGAPCCEATR